MRNFNYRSTRGPIGRAARKSSRNRGSKSSSFEDNNNAIDDIGSSVNSLKCLQYLVSASGNLEQPTLNKPSIQVEKSEKSQQNETIVTNLALLKSKLLPVTRRQTLTQNTDSSTRNSIETSSVTQCSNVCETSNGNGILVSTSSRHVDQRVDEVASCFSSVSEARMTRSRIALNSTKLETSEFCNPSPNVNKYQLQTTPKVSKTGPNHVQAQVLFNSPVIGNNNSLGSLTRKSSRIEQRSRSPLVSTSGRFNNLVSSPKMKLNNIINNDSLDDMNDSIADEDFILASQIAVDCEQSSVLTSKNIGRPISSTSVPKYELERNQSNPITIGNIEQSQDRIPNSSTFNQQLCSRNNSAQPLKTSNEFSSNSTRILPTCHQSESVLNIKRPDISNDSSSKSGFLNQMNVQSKPAKSSNELKTSESTQFTSSVDSLFMSKSQPLADDDFDSDDDMYLNIDIESDDSFSQALAELPVETTADESTVLASSSLQNCKSVAKPTVLQHAPTVESSGNNDVTKLTTSEIPNRSTPISKTRLGRSETPKSSNSSKFKRCQSFQQETSTEDVQTGTQMKQQIELKRQQALERLKQRRKCTGR